MTKKKDPKDLLKMGRPTKYKPEYCEGIVKYFETCQAEILFNVKFFNPNKNNPLSDILNPLADKEQEETLKAGGVKEIEQKLVMQRFPTFTRYAMTIGVYDDTLDNRDEKYPDFLRSREVCRKIQEVILLENGLQGTYNSQFAQFLLKNNHGYKDKSEVETTVKIIGEDELMD